MTPDEAVEKVKDWMQSYEVTAEQELAELRRELEALADTLDEGADESEDFNNGFMEAADRIRETLARKPGAQ